MGTKFLIILFIYFLVFGWAGWMLRGVMDGKKGIKMFADGYQARINFEHGK